MRIYEAAKKAGCKFYFGTDAHHPKDFSHQKRFEIYTDLLGLTENDKFII